MTLYLVGYMYSGKTTLGRHLAKQLGFDFADTDTLFEQHYHTTIPLFFNRYGEEAFRKLEQQVLYSTARQCGNSRGLVVATGGGTPCYEDNMEWINDHGVSVFLTMSAEAIVSRAAQSKKSRPLLVNKDEGERLVFIQEQLRQRLPYYQKATLTIEALNATADKVAAMIERLNSRSCCCPRTLA